MSLADYTGLSTAVTSWMDITAADLTSQIADVITLGETRIFREARTRQQETSFSLAISSGSISVPSNYIALKNAYIDMTPTQHLERRSSEWLYQNYPQRSSEGIPKVIAREGSNFIFGPYPDSGYTVNGRYYKKFSALAGGNAHALFANNPDLYLFACLAESEIIIGRSQRTQLWEAKYKQILADVNGLDMSEAASGSTLRMRVS